MSKYGKEANSRFPRLSGRNCICKEEAALTLVKVGDVILMTQKPLEVDSVAKKARKEMNHSGLTVEDILAGLDRQRARYSKDRRLFLHLAPTKSPVGDNSMMIRA